MDLRESLRKRMDPVLQMNDILPQSKKMKPGLVWILVLLAICFVGAGGLLFRRVQKLSSKQKVMHRSVKMLEYGVPSTLCFGKTAIPYRLAAVPFSDDLGIVVAVKEVNIRNVVAPYNPSIIKSDSGYDLFFRYDVMNPRLKFAPFSSRIGAVPLNAQFEQEKKEFKRLNLQTEYGDDPRVLAVGDQVYLFYNRMDESNPKCRFMCAANLDRNSYDINYQTILDMNLQWIEKNWSPFEYIDKAQKPHLFLEYRISPRKLLELPDPKVNELKNVTVPSESAYLSLLWSGKWGEIKGGTPAQKIGDEYLSFFHSFFVDESKLIWYVMGAYTFEASPPFNMTRISKYPLLFKGIYETPFANSAGIEKRVIFPSGFVVEKEKERELIHLACGENDCGVKIVTLDKDQLIKNMIRFETKE